MKRTMVVSFAAALLAGAAGVAVAPPGASAQQMQHYDRSNANPYDAPDQGGPGDWFARQAYDQGQFGGYRQDQYGRDGFARYDQPHRQYGQAQQYGPEDFGQAGRYRHYGSRSQYGFPPYDPDRQRMLQYGSRQQYGFPPYREGGGFQGQQYGQAMPGGDFRSSQGADAYGPGQQQHAQGRMGPHRPFGPEMRYQGQGPGYRQFGQFEGMPQRQAYAGRRSPEETYIREARREATGVPVPEQVLVTSANDLVGRTVHDMNGDPAGRVAFIMVDARSGDVSYAILGEGRGLEIGADYVAVPWSAIAVRPGDEQRITLNISRDRLMQAPRLTEDDLAALASPAALTRVTAFYAVPTEEGSQAQAGQSPEADARQDEEAAKRDQQARQQDAQQQDAQQQAQASAQIDRTQLRQIRRSFQQADRALSRNDTQAALDELGQISRSLQVAMQAAQDPQEQQLLQVQEPIRQARQALQDGQPQQARNALRQAWQPFRQVLQASAQPMGQQQAQQQMTPQAMQGGARAQPAHPAILVGRRVVTTLHAPTLLSPAQLRGNAVVTPHGEPVGMIDQVMLDLKRDHVAYLLLASGGFLGMDEVWIPVPFESLDWSDEALSYVLDVGPRQLAAMPVLHKEELPTQVSTRHLAMLYRHYGVTPYWQKPAVAMIGEGPGIGHPVRGEMAGLSPEDVRRMLSRQGFTEISDIVREGDSYQATARMGGREYELEIDTRNRIVFARGAS